MVTGPEDVRAFPCKLPSFILAWAASLNSAELDEKDTFLRRASPLRPLSSLERRAPAAVSFVRSGPVPPVPDKQAQVPSPMKTLLSSPFTYNPNLPHLLFRSISNLSAGLIPGASCVAWLPCLYDTMRPLSFVRSAFKVTSKPFIIPLTSPVF